MPSSLQHLYHHNISPILNEALHRLGSGWEVLIASESYLLDNTFHDQYLHIDGESQAGIAFNIVVMVEDDFVPQFNVVSGSHNVITGLLNSTNSQGSLSDSDYETLESIAANL